MRVLHVINGFGPGGAERSLVDLLPIYRTAGIQCTVAHLKDRNVGYMDEAQRLGLPLHRLPGRSLRRWIPALRKLLRNERPHLIHTSLFEADLAGRFAAVSTGIPVVSSLVSLSYDPARKLDPNLNQQAFRFVKLVDGLTARHLTNHFHALTETVKSAYINTLGLRSDRITVVPRGRSGRRLGSRSVRRRLDVRERLGINLSTPLLLNVGRQEYAKGQIHIIEAMPRILCQEPDALLLVAGRPGAQTSLLEAAVEGRGLERHIRFLGHYENVADLMAAADIFLFPSLFEGQGGSVVEAMALGLPIVASDIPVLREVIGDKAGLYFSPGHSADLAGAVTRLLSVNDEAERLGRAGTQRFTERFELETTAARMIELYTRVARQA